MATVYGEPQSIWSLGAPLLEGPVWVEREAALWFVDIKSQKIHRYDPANGDKKSWDAPAQVGFCLPIAGDGFVAGLQTGLARFDPADGSFTPLHDPEPALPGNRLNDGTVGPDGRLWFGTMDDGEAEPTGHIHRLDHGPRTVPVSPPVSITNGPALSPDGRTLYHVDTLGGLIHACTVDDTGALSDPRLFARIDNADGYPDGPTVDAEGCVWIGLYQGGAVRRYSPAGELLATVRFPVSAITKVAFGGADLKTLYATTAAKHLSPEARGAEPMAGNLFALPVDVPGVPGFEITIGV
jgi:xylono-1,5-lactonase